jgi:membrane-associated phospholipid phosphatase
MRTLLTGLSFTLVAAGAAAQAAGEISEKDRYGQVIRIALPAAAAALSLHMDDPEGLRQLAFSTALSAGSTELLKRAVRAKRPDGRERDSFPSGHAALTFSTAAYVHERYSLQWALPFYGLAAFTAYKRVSTRNHYTRDVIAGAAVGMLSAWVFTGRYTSPRAMASFGYYDRTFVVNYASTW